MAFGTYKGELEYQVMQFALPTAQATFQCYIYDCIWPCIDDFVACYLDDILIYLANKEQQEDHARHVLQQLREFSLYCYAEKIQF